MSRPRACVVAACFPLSLVNISQAEEFPIHLEYPSKVGDRAETSWIATEQSKSTMNYDDRETERNEDRRIEIEETEEIRRVDPRGAVIRMTITLKRCEEILAGAKKRTVVAPGRTITLTAGNGETQYALDSGRLSPADQVLLRLVLQVREENAPDDDEIFGTKEPKVVGASWPIGADALIRRMRQSTYDPIDPKQVKGTTKFVGIDDLPDVGRCFQFESNLTVENMTGKSEGYKLEDGDFECIDAVLIPMRGGDPLIESSASQFHQTYTSTYNGIAVRVESQTTRTVEIHRKPLEPNPAAATQPTTIPSTRPAPKPLSTTTTTAAITNQVR